ncbi:hypothetical protein [Streptosporangium subroseum]|uniref:hypothetical protein n=1 Tax=Streptosporangium subroseum TaxID=106412 RepID=UPI00308A8EA1|nr:hypothetical protein OHB15_16175 [Streptosporangium subroseum]
MPILMYHSASGRSGCSGYEARSPAARPPVLAGPPSIRPKKRMPAEGQARAAHHPVRPAPGARG